MTREADIPVMMRLWLGVALELLRKAKIYRGSSACALAARTAKKSAWAVQRRRPGRHIARLDIPVYYLTFPGCRPLPVAEILYQKSLSMNCQVRLFMSMPFIMSVSPMS